MEPIFKREPYSSLVPQIEIKYGNEQTVSILEAGHRLGDAIIRSTELQEKAQEAFRLLVDANDASKIAKLAPTSLVFGVWDSRDTQARLPRLMSSTIRAFDVRKLTRSAQYVPAAEYIASGMLADPDEVQDQKAKNRLTEAYAARGFIHVPASSS